MTGRLPPARPVNDDDRDEVLLPLVSGVQELLFAPVNPFNNRPAFVAGPPPDTGLARAVQEVTRLNCRIWASRDKSGYSPRVNQYNGEVCDPYLESLDENPDGGYVGPEFKGGQCAIDYFVNGNQVLYGTDGQVLASGPFQVGVRGPIGGLSWSDSAGGPVTGPLAPNATGFYAVLASGTGPQVIFGNGQGGASGSITSVVPQGPVPDNCGDPSPVVQPPSTVTPKSPIVPTVPINLPGIGPITVTVNVDDKGRPVIIAPEIGVEVTVNPPDDDDDGEGGGGSSPPPGDVGNPGAGGSASAGDDAEGEAPPGKELVGLKLTLVNIPARPSTYAPGVYRGAAYIYMGTPTGLDQDYAGSMLREQQFVFAERKGLTKWLVKANDGYEINVVPYYREPE